MSFSIVYIKSAVKGKFEVIFKRRKSLSVLLFSYNIMEYCKSLYFCVFFI